MALTSIRIWRYNSDSEMFESLMEGWSEPIEIHKECTPYSSYNLQDRDFMIEQKVLISSFAIVPHSIPVGLATHFPDRDVPPSAGIWHFDGESTVSEVYRRSTASEAQLPLVESLCQGDEELYIMYCGLNTEHNVFYPSVGKWAKCLNVESIDVTVKLGTEACTDLLHLDDRVLVALLIRLGKITSKIKEIAAIEDPATKTMVAIEATKEVIMGAEPGAVQGHNVLHSSVAIMDQIQRIGIICAQGQEGNKAVQSDNYSSGLSQVAGGVGFIDGGWQVLGSFASFISSVVDLNSIINLSEDERRAKYGDWAKVRKTESAMISAVKTSQTVSSLVTAIQSACSVAQTVPKTLVPVIGIATALVTIGHSGYKAGKSLNRHRRLKNILDNHKNSASEDVAKYLAYAMAKTKRKGLFRTAEAGTAVIGAGASTCLTVGAVVAGANFWNPVGWGLGIAAFVGGSGLMIRKVYRSATSHSRNARLWGFTRAQYPKLLIDCFLKHFETNYRSQDTEVLVALLEAYGVRPIDLFVVNSVGLAELRIARHLES